MDKTAAQSARECLSRANAAFEHMENSQRLEDIDSAWSDFLTAAHRIYSKLEQGAKVAEASKIWFREKKYQRKTDPALQYIHHARNADEHGIVRVTEKTAGGLALGVGPGAWRFDGTLGPGGAMKITALGDQVPGVSKFIDVIPSKVRLRDVIDRGVKYEPPKRAEGQELTPIEVAKSALVMLQELVEQAESL
jgi:hypothetical protein